MRHYHGDTESTGDKHGARWREHSLGARIGIVVAGVVVAAGFGVLAGYIVVWLWNWLMPVIFHLPVIGFWQAWGLLILSAFFFKRPFSSANRFRRNQRRRRALRERLQDIGDEEGEDNPRGSDVGGEGAT